MTSGRSPASFLEYLQGLIERTYDIDRSISDIAGFVIGDQGYRRLTAAHRVVYRVARSVPRGGPAVLVRQVGDSVQASLYYPDWLIRELERHPPLRRLDQKNLEVLALFVEELDHLLLLADRARYGIPITLVEMEFHANVTKELVVRWLYGRHRSRRELDPSDRAWLRQQLNGDGGFDHLEVDRRGRYEDAARLAAAFFTWFDRLPRAVRLSELRRFHRRSWGAHLQFLSGKTGR
jgi:hypothetical protein